MYTGFQSGSLKGKENLGDLDVNAKIILKVMFKKQDRNM